MKEETLGESLPSEGHRLLEDGARPSSIPDTFDFNRPTRERTLTLMRMCLLSYPSCQEQTRHNKTCGYRDAVMEPIWKRREELLGPSITDRANHNQAMQEFYDDIQRLLVSSAWSVRDVSAPKKTAKWDTGVVAFEWKRDNTTVLVFRGTTTEGEDHNIENWIMDYVLEKSTAQMKRAWTQDAHLHWTDIMKQRADRSDVWEKWLIRIAESSFKTSRTVKDRVDGEGSFPQDLVDAANDDPELLAGMGGLSLKEAKATGYWKITKYIVNRVVKNLPEHHTLILTGHSQGATRAQFASMYLYQTKGWKVSTVTFAATGSSCAARLFFSDYNILADLDPFLEYDNMIEYVHPLDPWGNAMLGMDNGKSVCFFGSKTAQLAETGTHFDGAYEYCSRVYGWSGPTILVSSSGVSGLGGPLHPQALYDAFARCRYYTHNTIAMMLYLEAFLDADGGTDGGCREIPLIPRDDPEGLCPTGIVSLGEGIIFAELLILILLTMVLLCSGVYHC